MAVDYVTREGEMLDEIGWRHYGFQEGAVEAILAANPRLSGQGPVLPGGVRITLPDLAAPRGTPPKVRLWDDASS